MRHRLLQTALAIVTLASGCASQVEDPSSTLGPGTGSGATASTGGTTGTGGATDTGGTTSTGGSVSTGGTTDTGGTASTGGFVSTGGIASTGGFVSTGGTVGSDPTSDSASAKGPYNVQSYTSGYADSLAYAAATIWYSDNAPTPAAGVAVSPGWTETQLLGWGEFLASHGFIVLTLDTNNALTDLPPQRATALMAAIDTIISENTRGGSPLQGKVDTGRMAIMGHSMGGGGTLIAANTNSNRLKAAIPLCPWNGDSNFSGVTVPTMIISGQLDSIAGIASHAVPFYAAITGATYRSYVEMSGADHFIANNPLLSPVVARYALSWLQIHVNGDARYQKFLVNDPALSKFDIKP